MYDLVGDIHGYADELVQLLEALGYQKVEGTYRHSERKVIFVGDFIDRGPKIRQVLEIVRPMIEGGHALAVMGNHELNALAYHTEDPKSPGEFLRPHSDKNVGQHRETVEQLKSDELSSYLEWFRTLPMWLDLDGLRVVHACWDEREIATIEQARKEQGVPLRLPMAGRAEVEQPQFRANEDIVVRLTVHASRQSGCHFRQFSAFLPEWQRMRTRCFAVTHDSADCHVYGPSFRAFSKSYSKDRHLRHVTAARSSVAIPCIWAR